CRENSVDVTEQHDWRLPRLTEPHYNVVAETFGRHDFDSTADCGELLSDESAEAVDERFVEARRFHHHELFKKLNLVSHGCLKSASRSPSLRSGFCFELASTCRTRSAATGFVTHPSGRA